MPPAAYGAFGPLKTHQALYGSPDNKAEDHKTGKGAYDYPVLRPKVADILIPGVKLSVPIHNLTSSCFGPSGIQEYTG